MDDFMMDDGGFFSFFETGFPIIFGIIFILVTGTFIFIIFKNISQWSHNNKQPRLNVIAKVVTKRAKSKRSDDSSTTWYYATFEMESGRSDGNGLKRKRILWHAGRRRCWEFNLPGHTLPRILTHIKKGHSFLLQTVSFFNPASDLTPQS